MTVTNLTGKRITLIDGTTINPYEIKKLFNKNDFVAEQIKNLKKLNVLDFDY